MIDSDEVLRRERILEALASYRGKEALYREGSRFSRVRIGEIEHTEQEVAALVELIPTPGLFNGWHASSWQVARPWHLVKTSDDLWVNPWVSIKFYFEEELIAAVLRAGEELPPNGYDDARFDQIGNCIWKYRKKKLQNELKGELTLFCNDQPMGVVSEIFLFEFAVHGKFTAFSHDEETWRKLPSPQQWRLETPDGRAFDCDRIQFQSHRQRITIGHCARRDENALGERNVS